MISDEIYEHLIFDETPHFSVASISASMRARTLLITGVSRVTTGWRVGITAGPAPVIKAMSFSVATLHLYRCCIPNGCCLCIFEPKVLQDEMAQMKETLKEEEIYSWICSAFIATARPQGAFMR